MGEYEMNNYQNEVENNPVTPQNTKGGLTIAGLVLGIIGVSTAFIPIVNNLSFIVGILAVIFGGIGVAKKKGGKAVAALVLGILSIVITLIMQNAVSDAIDDSLSYLDGSKTQEILEDYLDVKIGRFTIIEGEYYDDTELTVTVKNKGKEKQSFSIKIEAVDASGNRIETDTIYVSDLSAGQSQSLKAFTYVTDEKTAQLKKATFRVLEVTMY